MSYLLEVQELKSFINGQLELYKIEFSETGNNKYLDVMNRLNITLETINKMDEIIQKLSIENKELKK
tara:strand:- start:121 stop:321 length:201 start_codon:yes stop_codon:yes gene_type:complete